MPWKGFSVKHFLLLDAQLVVKRSRSFCALFDVSLHGCQVGFMYGVHLVHALRGAEFGQGFSVNGVL